MNVEDVAADLAAEQQNLDELVAILEEEAWGRTTPSPRWTVADQIAHLTYFDEAAATAIVDPDRFRSMVDDLVGAADGGDESVDDFTLGRYRKLGPVGQLDAWRSGRERLAKAATTLTDDTRVIWYGPSMGAKSFLTARLMEAWAHGQDVIDAVGGQRPATNRLRHVAQLGVITRQWSYINRQLNAPEEEVRVELYGPSGSQWVWGSEETTDSVRGSAEDFCLVVTQRRHLNDTKLEVTGGAAMDWMHRAQAFAGPPTDGPPSRSS
ncbi:MAG: TIGR03084 family metal-binding protein [Actinomycetota bacterium]|nr:TIGR03084 family metal-binding protein [Actinomycetota bacterium]